MPCNGDYLKSTDRERQLQRAAGLLVYVYQETGHSVPAWAIAEAGNMYASDERCITELCAVLKAMEPAARDALVYNARSKVARHLADWWEEHMAADAGREVADGIYYY